MTDEKRPGSMSGDDRALAGAKARLAARAQAVPEFAAEEDSLPIITEGDDDPTPVENKPGQRRRKRQSVQAFAEDIKLEVRGLRAAIDEAIRAELNNRATLAERLVKVETRLDFLAEMDGAAPAEELLKLRADLTSLRVTLIGESGKNGMVSQVRDEATRGPRFMKRAIAAAVGGILGTLIPAALFVRGLVADSAAERATFRAEIDAAKVERSVLQSQVLLLFRLSGSRSRGGVIDPLAPSETRP